MLVELGAVEQRLQVLLLGFQRADPGGDFVELALLAWFWVTPIVYPFEQVATRDTLWSKIWMANPVTPIVLIFQRALYAKLDNPPPRGGPNGTPLLPHWDWWGYAGYLGMSIAFGLIMLAVAIWFFGRSETNFAEEL